MYKFVLALCLITTSAAAFNTDGKWDYLSPEIKGWFQKDKIKICCSQADGVTTDYEIKDGGYWVPVPWHPQGREFWVKVPNEVVINNLGNPIGQAIIWYNEPGQWIRCFVPGGGF